MAKKYFTFEEANELIPTLEYKLPKLLRIKKELAQNVASLVKRGINVEELFAKSDLDDELRKIKTQMEKLGAALNESLADIQNYGCLVKDLDLGLVDFYCSLGDQEIFYCWQLGEKEIGYWHLISEDFGKRKPLFDDEDEEDKEKKYH